MKGDIYHIVNRGVEKRKIFLNEGDLFRFRDNLYDFNRTEPVVFSHHDRKNYNLGTRGTEDDELVDILSACLMPNHFHILAQEKVDGGMGLFSKKITGGYTQSFNLKNERTGFLFQGRTKKILVKKDEHFLHLPYYIFANPIKLVDSRWKEKGIKDIKKTMKFLEEYRWSSLRESLSGKEGVFKEIVNRDLFLELFGFKNLSDFKKVFIEWVVSQTF